MGQSKLTSNGETSSKSIIIPYTPRPLQREVHNNLKRFNVLVCHRRFGKSVLSINQLIKTAVAKPMRKCAFIAPTYRQGKSIAWEYLGRNRKMQS